MATIGTVSKPGYVYDADSDTWIPIGVGAHTHDYVDKTLIDAKGDLLVGSSADSVNRLAVGSNDQVLVADSGATTGMAWKSYGAQFVAGKNKIINGDFFINQRAFTSNTTDGAYNFDRWFQSNGGTTGTFTLTPQTFTPGSAPVSGYEARNFLRCVTASGASTNTYAILAQRIEDVRTLAGQTATISFWAKAGSGTPKVTIEIGQNYGSGGSPSPESYAYAGQVTLSTSWTRYSVTVSVPSISGKTLGTTANTSNFLILLWCSGGSTFDSRTNSLGLQNATFDFWGVQVEAGSVATAFQTATGTLQGELAACQRYFEVIGNEGTTNRYFHNGWCDSTTVFMGVLAYKVTKRAVPTITVNSAGSFQARTSSGSGFTATNFTATVPGLDTVRLDWTTSGLTQHQPGGLVSIASGNPYIHISSEL